MCTLWHKKSDGQHCNGCKVKIIRNTAVRTQKRLSQGQCIHCDSPLVTKRLCLIHFLKFAAKFHLGTSKRYKELQEIFDKQNGICPYTNKKLTLGLDASLDHILPKSRGGSLETDNLQWVYYQVNFMKGDMTNKEFIQIIKSIYLAVSSAEEHTSS